MTNKKFWLGILVLLLVSGMTIVGCNNGSTNGTKNNDGADTKKVISEKWEISNSNSLYSSFEFTKDNVYIVVENINQVSKNIHSLRSVFSKNSDEKQQTIRSSEGRAANSSESNLSPIHTGKYTINGNKITLEGFGVLNIISLTTEEFVFSFKLENSNNAFEYHSEKAGSTINESSKTTMLCRYWKVDKISDPYIEEYAIGILISKAGTYLCTYKDGSAGLAEWKWANKEETIFQYSWTNWESYGNAKISELTATKLKVIDHFDIPGEEVIYELILGQ